jgi:threonine/homoserine/homoserine lactone efflux protein
MGSNLLDEGAMTIEFMITSLIVVASPGTGALITLAAGLSRGRRAAIVAALGCTLGILPHMLAAITGLAMLLRASAIAFEAIKYAGIAYLLYMAWMTLKADGPLKIESGHAIPSDRAVIRHAILANLLNPKLSIFFFAFLPQFVGRGEERPMLLMLELSLVFMAMTFAVFAAYGIFAAGLRDRVLSRPAILMWMRRGFAAAFVGLGVKLALVQR